MQNVPLWMDSWLIEANKQTFKLYNTVKKNPFLYVGMT